MRFNQGLKTIIQMEKSVRADRDINENNIPPPVVVRGGEGSGGSSTPAALSPSQKRERTPPSVPPHASPPATIPHDVVFQDREKLAHCSCLGSLSIISCPGSQVVGTTPQQHGSQPAPRSLPPTSDPASIIRTLHNQYKAAALAAKCSGDKEHAVKYMCTMKQMEPMLAVAQQGQPVDLTSLPRPSSASGAPSQPVPVVSSDGFRLLVYSTRWWGQPPSNMEATPAPACPSLPASIIRTLHNQYKAAAVAAKHSGDKEHAVKYMHTMKQMEPMLAAAQQGQPVDLTSLPGAPSQPRPAPSSVYGQPCVRLDCGQCKRRHNVEGTRRESSSGSRCRRH